jgi:hypothetical protein
MARNMTMAEWGGLEPGQYLIHDRDNKFCAAFRQLIDDAGVKLGVLPPRSPNLNAYTERWVRGREGVPFAIGPIWGGITSPCADAGCGICSS